MILSAPFMPQPQPVIDGFEFASAGASLEGALPIRDFPRLRDLLAGHDGEVAYEVEGGRDERGRPALRLKVRGRLELRCQRCLEALPFEVRADEMLVLAGMPRQQVLQAGKIADRQGTPEACAGRCELETVDHRLRPRHKGGG